MRVAFLRMISTNSRDFPEAATVEQGLGVALNGGQRRAQLMGDIGDEIAPRLFHPLDVGLIVQYGDRATAGHGSSGHVEDAAGKILAARAMVTSRVVEGILHRSQNFRIAHRLH